MIKFSFKASLLAVVLSSVSVAPVEATCDEIAQKCNDAARCTRDIFMGSVGLMYWLGTGIASELHRAYQDPIKFAVFNNQTTVVHLLLAAGGVASSDHLRCAIHYSNAEVIQTLLDAGVDPKGLGTHLYAVANDAEKVKMLLDAGLDSKEGLIGALHVAAEKGNLEVVDMLLSGGADINDSIFVSTALMDAAARGHLNVVKRLLEAGARVDTRQRFNGKTAMDLAKNDKIRALLLAKKAEQEAAIPAIA